MKISLVQMLPGGFLRTMTGCKIQNCDACQYEAFEEVRRHLRKGLSHDTDFSDIRLSICKALL